jgi:hypothetical protein
MQLIINWSARDISCGRLEKKKERGQNKMQFLKLTYKTEEENILVIKYFVKVQKLRFDHIGFKKT